MMKLIYSFLALSLITSPLLAEPSISKSEIHLSVQYDWSSAKQDYARSKKPYDLMRVRMAEYYGLLLNKHFTKAYDYCASRFKALYDLSKYEDLMLSFISRVFEANKQPTMFSFSRIFSITSKDFPEAYLTFSTIIIRDPTNTKHLGWKTIKDYWILEENTWRVLPGDAHRLLLELELKMPSLEKLKDL